MIRFLLAGAAALAIAAQVHAAEPQIEFVKHKLDATFRSEGVAVADFNHDGKLDIAAGSVYYAAPDWKMVPVLEKAEEYKPEGYSPSFCNFAEDLNGDGWPELIVVDFPGKETWWFENPQTAGGAWKKHLLTPVTNNESPTMVDVDGDGVRELVCAVSPNPQESDGPQRYMALVHRPKDDVTKPWTIEAVSAPAGENTVRYAHGLGVGDVNGDGRNDVVVPQGWWESPDRKSDTVWAFHKATLGEACSNMQVFDFDGDNDRDVLSSSAHGFGIWWHEQTPEGFKTHLIDKSFSQTHSLVMADINGDKLPDFVTGKRWKAHFNGDPGGDDPAVLFWYELAQKDGKPTWTQHKIDDDSGVGTQFEVIDVNGDNLLDVVTSNKKGVQWFEQVRK